jgi:two-component system LytT family response regulator
MNHSVVIIDDEPNGAESVYYLLQDYCPSLTVKAIAYSVSDAVRAIELHKPSLVFLDIQMPTGSGFDVIEQTRHVTYNVIFTTAHEEFALQAIKANAIDYLLKPIIAEELTKAVHKALHHNQSGQLNGLLNMVEQLHNKQSGNKITVANNEGLLFIEPTEIVRLEADSNYTHIHLADGKKITASKTLKEIEKLLPSFFIKTHTSHIINRNKMAKYIKGDGGYVVLTDSVTVPVSRSYKADFLAAINKG